MDDFFITIIYFKIYFILLFNLVKIKINLILSIFTPIFILYPMEQGWWKIIEFAFLKKTKYSKYQNKTQKNFLFH